MGREKNIRKLNFQPSFKEFIPASGKINGITNILDEEIEAIYLMDILELYQEEAAKKMEVSRPTFTRILKNARQKLSTAIISGHKINIENNSNINIVAICSDDENFHNIQNNQTYIFLYKINQSDIEFIRKLENPVNSNLDKPAILLPKIFIENNVNIFVSSKIGEGLKNSLISKGIKPIVKEKIELNLLSSIIKL
jgi:predicted DNA-binding protein (UPF0251 family)